MNDAQICALSVSFPLEHAEQLAEKAKRFRVPLKDLQQDVSRLILERGKAYNPAKSSIEAFIFGHLEGELKRLYGCLMYADSLDTNAELREEVEAIPVAVDVDYVSLDGNPALINAVQAVEILSGKNMEELAQQLGVTKRRVRQLLRDACDYATASDFDSFTELLARFETV